LLRKSGVAKLFSKQFEFALALLESSAPKSRKVKAGADEKQRIAGASAAPSSITNTLLFTGCVGAGLFARVNEATARVLAVNGFGVQTPPGQVCCGALHAHAGDLDGARTLARKNVTAFDAAETVPVITNAGGCGAMLASYGHLLDDDEMFAEPARRFSARIRDVGQQLETGEIRKAPYRNNQSVTYDASCHLLYGQHAGEAPLEMVGALTEVAFAPLAGSERCCGGAGIYNLLEPDLSSRVLAEKLASVRATGAKILATGNPGCQMQIGAGAILSGMDLVTCHPVELLDEAYAAAGIYQDQSKVQGPKSKVTSPPRG
jgi:glycolate oxidase iron-sulfur subunit